MRRFAFFLAFKHIRRRILQSVLTVLGVAVGVMVLVTALSLTNGFIAELVRSTLQATPHITLNAGFTNETFAFDPVMMQQLEASAEVVAVAPFITTQALIARRANKDLGLTATRGYTQIIGIDPVLEQKVLADLPQLSELKTGDGIVLGRSLGVRQLAVIPGDEVLILNELQKRQSFIVSGTFRVGNELIDALVSYTSIPVLQDYLNVPGEISGYHVRVKNPERASFIAQDLARESGLISQSWQSLFSNLIEQLKLQKALIGIVVFLIVLVAAMGIANILILTVAEKTEEIAILRAMGASQRQILTVFMLEGIILGGIGTLLGALLGFAFSLYFQLKPFPLPGDLYFITALPVEMQAFDFIWVCALSLATSVIAAILPARRASGLDPVQILR